MLFSKLYRTSGDLQKHSEEVYCCQLHRQRKFSGSAAAAQQKDPEMLFLSAVDYDRISIAGDLMDTDAAKADITKFITDPGQSLPLTCLASLL